MDGLTVRCELAIENMVTLNSMIARCKQLNTHQINAEYGVAIFEQIHLMGMLEKALARTLKIIEDE